ncbi:MAG: valine--tRNA ligase [Bacteroidetes bacterium]|nr:valine--tRNA ligase [Bacteroidota bacterium]
MEIAKTYNPAEAESKWYAYWIKQQFFKSSPDKNKKPYTIVMPPPNVTGVLHMGHMLNNTIQDVLIRRARMLGYNACWVAGTDHASIATEAKVVALLKEKGIKKTDLSREKFLEHAWDWKEKYGGIILEQLKKLGASCDWDRTRFTMENDLSEAVIDVFIDLYNKGHIYRGVRMVNWDPQGLTAVSDEEVIYKEVNSKLYYVKYKIEGSTNEWITIATTRPETILGDTAICVNPNDERYTHLKGKRAIVPIVNRSVPIIFDEYVDKDFGTGALKVTPAHDINDYNLGIKHKIENIDVLNDDATINSYKAFQIQKPFDSKHEALEKNSPRSYALMYHNRDRFDIRKQIAKDLEELGHLVKIEDIKNKVGTSERTGAVIEPKLSLQWFLKMDKISKPALEAVLNGEINLIPEKFVNTYKHWLENVHDWCVSRQLWWGQRIPAWYDDKGNTVVAKTLNEAFEKLKIENVTLKIENVKQDDDVLDTWFSSWLWPLTVFDPKIIQNGWDKANKDLNYYYPTNDLVTAPEILFFWVARMIIAGKEYTNQKPFTNVYLTGIVRDKLGRKMSKSLGNSPDPLDLIAKYGADGVRVGMLLSSPAGNDLLFDESYCEQGRNFANKVWNAFRLIKSFTVSSSEVENAQPQSSVAAITWFENKLSEQLEIINEHYAKYRMSDALMATYKLVWDDFCAWYLEAIKPEFIDGKAQPIDKTTYDATINFLESLLKIMHPWIPFLTEEIWHLIKERDEKDCIIVAEWTKQSAVDRNLLAEFEVAKELVTMVRNVRAQKQISPKEKLEVIEKSDASRSYFDNVVVKLANLSAFNYSKEKVEGAFAFQIKTTEFFIPLANNINAEEEKERLTKDLEYNKGFLFSVQKKLANEKFVANAKPEIIAVERKKESDALSKIKAIEEQLAAF